MLAAELTPHMTVMTLSGELELGIPRSSALAYDFT
jgi:hypothetical protein